MICMFGIGVDAVLQSPLFEPVVKFLGVIIQTVGILIGAGIVLWQVGRNHKSNAALQRENYKEQLKLNLYQTLANLIEDVHECNSKLGVSITTLPGNLSFYWGQIGYKPVPIDERTYALNQKNNRLGDAVGKLIVNVERYEAALPRFDIFRKLFVMMSDKRSQAYIDFASVVFQYLPTDVPEQLEKTWNLTVTAPMQPTKEALLKLEDLSNKYGEIAADLSCWLHDLSVELQNHLVGSLFGNLIPPRKPLDPKHKVVMLNDSDAIKGLEQMIADWRNEQYKNRQTEQVL